MTRQELEAIVGVEQSEQVEECISSLDLAHLSDASFSLVAKNIRRVYAWLHERGKVKDA